MKLIILHHYSDGFTYSGTEAIPVERESAEALLCELEDWASSAVEYWKDTGITSATVLGKGDYCSVEVMTLDEWWEGNCVG